MHEHINALALLCNLALEACKYMHVSISVSGAEFCQQGERELKLMVVVVENVAATAVMVMVKMHDH